MVGSCSESFWPPFCCNGSGATEPQNCSSFRSLVICAASPEVLFYKRDLVYYLNSECEVYTSALFHRDCLVIWWEYPVYVAQHTPSVNPCIKQAKDLDENVTSSSWSIFRYLVLLCTHRRNTEYKQDKNPGLTPNHPHLPACLSHEHVIYQQAVQ